MRQKPSDYLRPELVPGGDPFIDEQGVVHLTDVASIQEAAKRERSGDFSMGLEWTRKALAKQGYDVPKLVLCAYHFPWTASLTTPDGNVGRWLVFHEILKEHFTKQAVRDLEPYITTFATDLVRANVQQQLQSGATKGVIDLAAFSDTLAFHVVSQLAGFPHDPADVQFMMGHLQDIANRTGFLDAFRPEAPEVGEYFDLITSRHKSAGGGGLLGHIIEAFESKHITRVERDGLILGLWSAGRDTTATLTALLFGLVDEANLVPKMEASLGENGATWRKRAIREASRFTPFAANPTFSTRDVTLLTNGFEIPALSTVLLHWAASNRDRAVYGADAHLYRPEREVEQNLAFGHSLHRCLGEALAIREVDIAARVVYGSLPSLRMTRWHRKKQFVDVVDVATAEYDLPAAARKLGLR